MTVVIGTAGHIDHGKTALLRALTGIDADRLPEERRRGMTIDVGYAHLTLPGGELLDFVDVPGHDRLVGNMLVGAGEIDAALLVVAADDGPRAQTVEHLALLDALGIQAGIVAVTKTDVAGPERTAEVVAAVGRLVENTSLAGSPVVAVSSVSGAGIEGLRDALAELAERVAVPPGPAATGSRLAIDRVFAVKGRGIVVDRHPPRRPAGPRRDAPARAGRSVRPRSRSPGPRNDGRGSRAGSHGPQPRRCRGRGAPSRPGADRRPSVVASDRILVRLVAALPDRARVRVHLGTAAVDAGVGRSGRDAIDLPDGSAVAILRLAAAIAVTTGDRLVLRRASGADRIVGAVVLDPIPARGISRRRQTLERAGRLASAVLIGNRAAIAAERLELHGAIGARDLAPDVEVAVSDAVLAASDPPIELTAARTVARSRAPATGDPGASHGRSSLGRSWWTGSSPRVAWSATAPWSDGPDLRPDRHLTATRSSRRRWIVSSSRSPSRRRHRSPRPRMRPPARPKASGPSSARTGSSSSNQISPTPARPTARSRRRPSRSRGAPRSPRPPCVTPPERAAST